MEFKFDPDKSVANRLKHRLKHGLDFIDAQALWDDPDLLEVPLIADDEPRNLVIAQIGAKHWAAIMTYRGTRIRLISVRRARDNEVKLYEST